jgi:hypothetical protein
VPRVAFFSLSLTRSESSGATCWQKARDGGGVRPGMHGAARDQLCLRPLTFVCTRCSLSLRLANYANRHAKCGGKLSWTRRAATLQENIRGTLGGAPFPPQPHRSGKSGKYLFSSCAHTHSALLGHLGRHSLNQNLVWAKTPFLLPGSNIQKPL